MGAPIAPAVWSNAITHAFVRILDSVAAYRVISKCNGGNGLVNVVPINFY